MYGDISHRVYLIFRSLTWPLQTVAAAVLGFALWVCSFALLTGVPDIGALGSAGLTLTSRMGGSVAHGSALLYSGNLSTEIPERGPGPVSLRCCKVRKFQKRKM